MAVEMNGGGKQYKDRDFRKLLHIPIKRVMRLEVLKLSLELRVTEMKTALKS
jgi:hypothetical protein